MSINKAIILGHLGADPECRSTPNGTQVATFRVACTEKWTDQSGQKNERTEWITCVAWKHLAGIAQKYLRKGRQVYVEGKIQTRSWEDKNGGGKRYTTEIQVEKIELVGAPSGGADSSDDRPANRLPDEFNHDEPSGPSSGGDDDLPF